MYSKYADDRGWKIQPMSSSTSERGGFKEVIFLISGTDVYKQLKFESGVHRVQRVPVTEANGRIHTSTVTVAVLPEAEEVDVQIDPQDLEITVTPRERAGRAGRQHDRFGRADSAQADGADRVVRRRAFAAEEQGEGDDGAALAAAQATRRGGARAVMRRRARARLDRAIAASGSAPTISRRIG